MTKTVTHTVSLSRLQGRQFTWSLTTKCIACGKDADVRNPDGVVTVVCDACGKSEPIPLPIDEFLADAIRGT